ncbi:unnamed protein product [Callosobruchus maculatus]|uniref:Odorant receptor n=1 Tax=Callosobruchus maculatus TaxID=64391 RepID=A0A653CBQ8_CALMS|nr:unnamed protein product [Callosobruchus maculatus]
MFQSNDLSRAIFHTDWVGSDRSLQQTLILFMVVTNKPLKVTLGAGTFTMSIPLFISICRTAYSFFTILRKFA